LKDSPLVSAFNHLTMKNTQYEWSEECEVSFQELKSRLVTTPVLTLPMKSVGYMVYTNASQKGLGCVLMQQGKVVANGSR